MVFGNVLQDAFAIILAAEHPQLALLGVSPNCYPVLAYSHHSSFDFIMADFGRPWQRPT